MNSEKYARMLEVIRDIKNRVLRLFEKGDVSKAELRKFTEQEFSRECIGFPRVSEDYRQMVKRLTDEESSEIIPNGTAPYEDLFKLFGIEIG